MGREQRRRMKHAPVPSARAAAALAALACFLVIATVSPSPGSAAPERWVRGESSVGVQPLTRLERVVSSPSFRDTRASSRLHIVIFLRVRPNRVALQQPFTATLHGAPPQQSVTFTLRRRAPGARGKRLGRHRADGDGVVHFHPRPFTRFEDVGRWVVTASFSVAGDTYVVRATLTVAGLLLQPRSPHVEPGKPYPFHLYTHCGVNFSVDFDHAFWDLTDPRWADQPGGMGPHKGLDNPFQSGTMTLVDARHARFDFVPITSETSTAGPPASIHFTRHVGPKIVASYCD